MALDKYRNPAEPLWEQRINQLEEGTGVGEITTAKIGSEQVTGAKVVPAIVGRRLLARVFVTIPEKTAAGLWVITPTPQKLEAAQKASEATKGVIKYGEKPVEFIRIEATSWEVTGRTSKLELTASQASNGVAPGVTLAYGTNVISAVKGAEKEAEVTYEAQGTKTEFAAGFAAETLTTKNSTATALATTNMGLSVLVGATETAAKSVVNATISLYVTYS